MVSPSALQGWEAAGHAAGLGAVLPWLGLLAFLAAWLALVVWGVSRARRYTAVDALAPGDVDALRAEIAAVERRSGGELAVVVLERSDPHPAADWKASTLTAIAGSLAALPALASSGTGAGILLACQLGFALLGWLTVRLCAPVRARLVPAARALSVTAEQAVQEFHRLGLSATADRTGVLIFVSLLERRVVVLGDEGIDARVEENAWTGTTEAILAGIRAGSLREGLTAGVRRAGELLAQHVPRRDADRNELADHVVVRRE